MFKRYGILALSVAAALTFCGAPDASARKS